MVEPRRARASTAARIHLVGDPMIDSLFASDRCAGAFPVARARRRAGQLRACDAAPRRRSSTTHSSSREQRRPGQSDRHRSDRFPVHPRTAAHLERSGDGRVLADAGVKVVAPVGYLEFIGLESDAADRAHRLRRGPGRDLRPWRAVLHIARRLDRASGDRSSGRTRFSERSPKRIREIPGLLSSQRTAMPIPFWDGHAGERAAAALGEFLAPRARAAVR